MKILVDMCLSPTWKEFLQGHGHEVMHWSKVGDPRATDEFIMRWAALHNHVVFTHDLDFGALLAATNKSSPSVIQIRTQNPVPLAAGAMVLQALKQFQLELTSGALIVVDESKARARILPFRGFLN